MRENVVNVMFNAQQKNQLYTDMKKNVFPTCNTEIFNNKPFFE